MSGRGFGKQQKLVSGSKKIKQEVAKVLESYDFLVHAINYSTDNRYAVVCGIERGGTPRVCVVAPGGMPSEEMHRISEIAVESFKQTIDRTLAMKRAVDA